MMHSNYYYEGYSDDSNESDMDGYENVYKQRNYGGGFNRTAVQQPFQQNFQKGFNNQR